MKSGYGEFTCKITRKRPLAERVDEPFRTCGRCKAVKESSDFLPSKFVGSSYCSECLEAVKFEQKVKRHTRSIDRYRQIKKEVVAAYGGGCRCCGETLLEFMSIDHVFGRKNKIYENDGTTASGAALWKRLKEMRYPQDRYRILCLNCNGALGFFGYCPHGKNQENPLRQHGVPPRRSCDELVARRRRGKKAYRRWS